MQIRSTFKLNTVCVEQHAKTQADLIRYNIIEDSASYHIRLYHSISCNTCLQVYERCARVAACAHVRFRFNQTARVPQLCRHAVGAVAPASFLRRMNLLSTLLRRCIDLLFYPATTLHVGRCAASGSGEGKSWHGRRLSFA